MDFPRLYIADLGAYNRGHLRGEWITVRPSDDAEYIRYRIQELLNEWGAEEYAIHDYEHLPPELYSEHPDFAAVVAYAELLAERDDDVVEAYFETEYWREIDPKKWARDIDARCHGVWSDRGQWAAEVAINGHDIPATIERYVNYDAMARDAEMNGEMRFVSIGRRVVAFSSI